MTRKATRNLLKKVYSAADQCSVPQTATICKLSAAVSAALPQGQLGQRLMTKSARP
jgi:hypothetical protein